jgi:hypothetical protein
MRTARRLLAFTLVVAPGLMSVLSPVVADAQRRTVPPAMSAITEADLRRDLYFLAGDSLRGREAGTLDEMRASMWIADQLRKIGVQPMGDNGTYFQWWNIRRTRLGTNSVIRIGEKSLTLWADIAAMANNETDITGTTVWAGDGSDTTIDVRGKVAIAQIRSPSSGGRGSRIVVAPEYSYTTRAVQLQGAALAERGAAAVILVADDSSEKGFEGVNVIRMRGTYAVDGAAGRGGSGRGAGANASAPVGTGAFCGGPPLVPDTTAGRGGGRAGAGGAAGRGAAAGAAGGGGRAAAGGGRAGGGGPAQVAAPVFLVRRALLNDLRTNGQQATIRLFRESFVYPSVNIVGVVRGTDPQLRNEYVIFSSHQDHDGVRYNFNGDSIWNGADDNGTVSVALLAAARAFVSQPARRSVLFIYHGAEERGLLGSRYYTQHPIVPLAQTVAVLNGDMIGRNNPDTASIMGVQPPHMNSRELVAMALEANALTGKFALDSLWDRPTHPEGWYRRSDHLPYAESCVPALMYSTNLHPDYHTPRDEPSAINYPKLARMTRWMYLTGWFVANADRRPALEPVFDVRR